MFYFLGTYWFGDGLSKYGVTFLGKNKCRMETEHVKTINLDHSRDLNKTNSFEFACFQQV